MSKKEKPRPYKIDDKWYLEGRLLDCHNCKYYAKQEAIETDYDYMGGYDYCSYHRFKFKFDLSPGSDYSACEDFTYDDSNGDTGLLGMVIGKLIFLAISYFILTRLFELSGSGLVIVLLFVFFCSFLGQR